MIISTRCNNKFTHWIANFIVPPRVQFTHGPGPGVFLREKRSSVNLRVFYAQFTLRSPHSCIYLGPGGAIKSAINHLNIGPGLREGESLRLPGPASI